LLLLSSLGYQHTEETKAEMSIAKQGENNPMYGTISPTTQTVFVCTLDMIQVESFPSHTAAAKWLGVARSTVSSEPKPNSFIL